MSWRTIPTAGCIGSRCGWLVPIRAWRFERTRSSAKLTIEEIRQKITALGARAKDGPWAFRVLRAIEERPGVLAARLARSLGMETSLFKPRVRQLKELGLTESLEIGYRLSPRGEAFLRRSGKTGD